MNWPRAHRTDIQMRFGDVDSVGHVNNVAYAQYLETARMAYLQQFELSTVIARLEMDYRREVRLRQRVRVEVAVARVGRSSFDLAYRVLAEDDVAAEARTVQVHVTGGGRRPAPLPDLARAGLEESLQWTAQ